MPIDYNMNKEIYKMMNLYFNIGFSCKLYRNLDKQDNKS